MQVIERTVCEVVNGHPDKDKLLKVWQVKEHPDKDMIGRNVCCGLPQALNYSEGTQHITEIRIP